MQKKLYAAVRPQISAFRVDRFRAKASEIHQKMQKQICKSKQKNKVILAGVCAKSVHPICLGLSLEAENIVCCSSAANFRFSGRQIPRESLGNPSKNAKTDMQEQTKKQGDFGRRLCKIFPPDLPGTLNLRQKTLAAAVCKRIFAFRVERFRAKASEIHQKM